MTAHHSVLQGFKARLRAREPLLGTFIKTPTAHATEILGEVGFDFVVVDGEHAPFGPSDIDLLMLASKAAAIPSLVRIPSADPALILQVLDCGGAGVLVPHMASAELLREVVAASRYQGGARGFSNSPRAGGYGTFGLKAHIEAGDASSVVLAMIEDLEALDQLDAIFAVEGLSGAFIGRGDLSAQLGATSSQDRKLLDAVKRITDAAGKHGVPLLAHVGSATDPDRAALAAQGVSGFIISSDQGLMRQAAAACRKAFDGN